MGTDQVGRQQRPGEEDPTLLEVDRQTGLAGLHTRQAQWPAGLLVAPGELERQMAYWRQRLKGDLPELDLPADRPRRPGQTYRGAAHSLALTGDLTGRLRALSRQEGCTLYITLLAAFKSLLYRYSNQADLLVGSPAATRDRAETDGLPGFFAHTLVLRSDLSGNPEFRQLLGRVQETVREAQAHADVPFAHLAEALRPAGESGDLPLLQAAFALQPPVMAPLSYDSGMTQADLALTLEEGAEDLVGTFVYNTDLFKPTTVARMAGHFTTLLEAIAANPDRRLGDLPLLTEAEALLLQRWNATATDYPRGRCIHELFEEQAARIPEAPALLFGERTVTYGELNRRANGLAHRLLEAGVSDNALVGLCADRSVEQLVGILAILKAGAAYVPLDPSYPAERLAFMLADTGVQVLLGHRHLTGSLPPHGATVMWLDAPDLPAPVDENPRSGATAESLAYVMYTSGSTGTPKGVTVPHRAVIRLVRNTNFADLSDSQVFLQLAPISFDASTLEIWAPLLNGGRLAIMPPGMPTPDELGAAIRRYGVTTLWLTAGFFHLMAEEYLAQLQPLRQLLAGGDVLSVPHVRKVLSEMPHCRLINGYGPTENTTFTCCYTVQQDPTGSVPIGSPIANTQVYVLDANLEPVPAGVPGELCTGGDGLAHGYLNRPELTAERFVQTPFGRLYRTGDRVRWREDGTIEFLGRFDSQVKIRGFRVEPGEVENLLGAHPAVGTCAVIVREDVPGDKRLVAYVVGSGGQVSAGELRAYLQERLPEFMLPSAVVMLSELPLTPNGKVDRRALPAPETHSDDAAPRSATEEILAGIWCELLGVSRVGIHDRFFELGGHSLLATRLISRIRTVFGVELPWRSVFAQPTVGGLAILVDQARGETQDEPVPPVMVVPREGTTLPLSLAQQRLWFLDQLEPGSPFYNIPAAWRVTGRLDAPVLEQSLTELVSRHEALRTTFVSWGGEPLQVIAEPGAVPLALVDLAGVPAADREAELHRVLRHEATRPFDLAAGPLLRAFLIRLASDEHVLMLNIHHIVADGWSMGVVLQELSALYGAFLEGQPSPLAPLPVQYADFAVWQRDWMEGGETARQLAYWKERMAGAPAMLELPTDRPRPAVQTFRGALLPVALPADLAARLVALSHREGTTLFMTLLAGFQALLARYSGQLDIVVGSPVAGRNREETEGLIGFFVNTLLHRTDLSGDPSFRELLARVREGTLGDFSHQDLPFQRLVEELQPERNLSHSPLFQVTFALHNAPAATQAPTGLTFAPVTVDTGTAKFDLSLSLEEDAEGLVGAIEYNTDLFDRATIERMAGHFRSLLAAAAAGPDQPVAALNLLSDGERNQLVTEWNETAVAYPVTPLIHELVASRAAEMPDAVAVVCGEERLTYAELDRRANQLAHCLRALGAGPEKLVGVCMERSPEMVVALLGALKAGAAYLPFDPAYPRERIAYMLEDAHVGVLLTQERLLGNLPDQGAPVICLDTGWAAVAGQSPEAPAQLAGPDNLAYVIYTSGSTGRPKGVMIEHKSLLNLVFWHWRTFSLTAADRTTQTAGVAFDAAVWEIWPTLAVGATLYLPDEETRLTPSRLRDWLVQSQITVSFLATPLAEQMLTLDWPAHTALRFLLTGGDKLHLYPPAGLPFHLVNCYGPTESTVVATAAFVPAGTGAMSAPSIGRPIANTRAYLLDHRLQPVPVGVTGELYIGGNGLARGYLNRPDLTNERFIETPVGKVYKTGDLARYLPDGSIEFAGRSDNQVKIRGFRIELGEIETVLKLADGVRVAVVIAREDQPDRRQLVAYVVPDEGRRITVDGLRAFLRQQLPDYMVPAAFVVLHELPLTPNGKVDRRALPAPEISASSEPYVAPRTPLEEGLAGIWSEVLGISRVGIYDSFFELGGHSLLATRITSRIRALFDAELPVRSLFAAPTVAGLAALVEEAQRQGQTQTQQVPLLRPVPREGSLPLSFAQQRLWFLDQLEPGSPFYNIPAAWRVTGPLDLPVLERCLAELVARHDALRTTFASQDGEPVQVIAAAGAAPVSLVDLTGLPPAEREAELQRVLRREAACAFDLAAGPLLRAHLIRLALDEHVLMLTMHHIVTDGWSMEVLLQELSALYGAFVQGLPSPLAPLPVQYADYAVWQRAWLEGGESERQLAYWKERMNGAPALLELPTDRPRPAVQTFRGALLPVALPVDLAEGLAALSRQEGTTLFMTLLAGFQALLARYTGQTDIVVGSPVAGRNRAETEALIGFFVNTLPHRTDFAGNPTFRELLARVREGALGAFHHQDLPLQHLVEELQPERTLSHSPLFQVAFALQNVPPAAEAGTGLTFAPVTVDSGTAKFDLTLFLQETEAGLAGEIEYSTDLFDRATIERLAGHFRALLAAAVTSPDQPVASLDLLSDAERNQLLVAWNDTAVEYPVTPLIHELVAARAVETPDAVAVVCGEQQLTYAELDRRANQLAHRLRALGAGPDKLVAVCTERSPDMLVALLGALKAGAAYLPIDPAYPGERIAYMLADAQVGALLTREGLLGQMPEQGAPVICLDTGWAAVAGESQEAPAQLAGPDNLAYVIYTSGSTGRPKGVMIEHRALLNLVSWHQRTFGLTAADRTTQTAGVAFDASVWEIWPTLAAGATLYLPDEETRLAPARLRDWLVESQITVSFLATPLAEQLLTLDWPVATALRFLLTGGDKLHVYPPAGLPFQLVNCYGPTESTVVATAGAVPAAAGALTAPSIGRPIANTRAYLLDEQLQPVPAGVTGELYIGSSGLARGYLNRPDLTAERFIESPYGRLYRTGDLARHLPDGSIEFAGRSDDQVKIRGFRIELGEIETVLKQAGGVQAAAVIVREDEPGRRQLVAYVVPEEGSVLTADGLRAFLGQQLPDYMVPAAFVLMDDLPLTQNGKVDRRALPAPDLDAAAARYVAPRTPEEEILAGIWSDVLGVSRVGIHDNFFELGGHSLLATRLTSRIRTVFGVELKVAGLFAAPTVAGLAALIEEARHEAQEQQIPPIAAVPREGALPLSFAQQRLWFLDQLEPGSPFYNIPTAWRVAGRLDLPVLERSLTELAARHEALRTTFVSQGGEPVQVIHPTAVVPVALTDLIELSPAEQEAELHRVIRQEAACPFDLAAGPLLRALLIRLTPDEHVLLLNVHHIVSDGWSMGVMLEELSALYGAFAEGRPSPLAPLPVQYADYAVWQRKWLESGEGQRQLGYWKERLKGAPAVLELPTDRPRPAVQTFRGALLPIALPADLSARLAALSRQEGATLFMTLLASFQALLSRYTGQHDIVVGAPAAGRTRGETEGLIGFFVNTLLHRLDLSGEPTFRQLLARVREGALGAFHHQDLPLQHLVEELQPERSLSHSPLFQVLFSLENAPAATQAGLSFAPVTFDPGTAKFDLSLFLQETDAGLVGDIEYNTDLFDRATMERLAGHFATLLASIAANPDVPVDSLPLLTAAEQHQLLTEWSGTQRSYRRGLLMSQLFEEQVARTPDAVALIDGHERLTYRELNRRANCLAAYLRECGVGPDVLVGVCMDRTADLAVALLGVLKAGGAYVPMDPAYPRERLNVIAEEAQVKVLLTEERSAGLVTAAGARIVTLDTEWAAIAAGHSGENVAPEADENHLAYVIYTSGSTGRPKGVAIPHASAVTFLHWAQETFAPAEMAGVLFATSICFDLSIFELFATLSVGGKVILAENVLELPLLPAAGEVTLINTVPSGMAELLRMQAVPTGVVTVNLAGEPLPNSLAQEIYSLGHVERVYNLYGPTEDTTYSTYTLVARGAKQNPSIGRPLPNSQVYIVDARFRPVPIGVPGELYIGGAGLARGYHGRPDLTAERFMETPMGRLYRTGDLARWLPDGSIDYLGRIDFQVKVRGFRIELGEIEEVLRRHAQVQEAVVVAREFGAGDRRLVAYVVPAAGTLEVQELREYLKAKLPEYMVPAAFVTLGALPLTPNGKVDRKALPAPDMDASAEGYAAPRTPLEEALAGLWSDVLGVGRVGIHDSFFALGGHSLLATQLVSRIRTALGVELPLRSLFAAPTVAELAELVGEARREAQDERIPPVTVADREGALPLSFAQQRLWFLDQMEPGSPLYNMGAAWRMQGRLDRPVLVRSLMEVAARHEALRTTFASQGGEPVQVIDPSADVAFTLTDLTDLPPADRETELHGLLRREAACPFDLAAGPLLRALLVRLAPEEHVLLLTVHHIVADGWSLGVLLRELSALYGAYTQGLPSPLPPLPVQYADYAIWQRNWLEGGELQRQLGYWKERLQGAPALLELPTDRPRPAVQSYRGSVLPVALPADVAARLAALSRQEGATLFMTLLAGFQALLARYTGLTDIVVGSPVAGRSRGETEGLIGFFVNTLLHRADLSGDPSFRELLARVREGALGAFGHQDLPFERLVEELQPERSLSHSPLFQVAFILQNTPGGTAELPGLTFAPLTVDNGVAKLDLTLSLEEGPDGIHGVAEYNTDLFDGATVERLMGHYLTLLGAAVADPDRPLAALPLLTPAERAQLEAWNATDRPIPEGCLHHVIAAHPAEKTAVVAPDEVLTYAELNRRADRLAAFLQGRGVGPEVLVGLCMERSAAMIVGLLGILRAGGAYLPLDPAYPPERLAFMCEDALVSVLVTQEPLLGSLSEMGARVVCLDRDGDAIEAAGEPADLAGPDNLAYVIYTSGSTGRPKGALIEHRGLTNLAEAQVETFGLTESERVIQFASLSFDASISEIAMALYVGGTLYLPGPDERLPGPGLIYYLREQAITNATLPPTVLANLPDAELPALRTLLSAGEALPAELVSRWAPGRRMFNAYGPTEATVCATVAQCFPGAGVGERPPIGRPVANKRVYVLDHRMQLVPPGVPGELYIAGTGLARGYLNRPNLTADRFLQTEYGRVYRTGDLVRWRPDGNLEFLGRRDQQVKLRGFRIELGEIEAVLAAQPGVREAVVVVREERPGDPRLVAYAATELSPADLRAWVKERLPEHMVPGAFVALPVLPLTPNGKVDRKALPAPTRERAEHALAVTPVQVRLAAIWQRLLGVEQVGIDENFFDLGGHSLLGARLIARIQTEFGVQLPLRALFAHPTVAELAAAIEASVPEAATEEATAAAAAADAAAALLPAEGPAPLSFAQRRLWFLDQFEPGSATYNVPATLRLTGTLDVGALVASLNAIVQRHEALRTTFAPGEGGEPVQLVAPVLDLPVPVTDLSGRPDPESEALEMARAEAARPFDLTAGPLIRAALLRLGPADHMLLLTLHHIVSDLLSMGVLFQELAVLYRAQIEGRPAALPPLAMQYPAFARWQRRWLQGVRLEEQLAYWQQRMAGAPAALELPTDRPRPAVKTYRGAVCSIKLPPELAGALHRLSRREGATLYMTLLTAFQVLLHRYSGQTDICVGTPVAGRSRQEAEELIGFFVSTLVMRTDLAGNPSFRELLARVRENVLSDFAHQDLPFENLVEALQPVRDTSRSPLFQVMFSMANAPVAPVELPGLTVRTVDVENGTAKFDLTLSAAEEGGALTAALEYNTDLFDAATAEALLERFRVLLGGIAAGPDQRVGALPVLTDAERRCLERWNETAGAYPATPLIHELVAARAAAAPDALAVVSGGERLTYADLDRRANQLAHYLRRTGVGPEKLVGVCVERSPEMLVALLGALKAGAAYLPIDPAYPRERIAYMLDDAQVAVLLTQERLLGNMPGQGARVLCLDTGWAAIAGESQAAPAELAGPDNLAAPDNLAYVIYTSGSTGRPKGVMIEHRALLNLVYWHQRTFGLTAGDRTTQTAGVAFDAAVWEIWPTLAAGATLYLPDEETRLTPARLRDWLVENQVTVSFLPTPLAEQVLTLAWPADTALRFLLTGGDKLHIYPPAGLPFHLVNCYGPTESTVVATASFVPAEAGQTAAPSIGRPIANTRIYLLDSGMQPVPVGVTGELYIGSSGLARGYLNRPDLTAERFIETTYGRLYRTGDLARYLPDGSIEFVGRSDNQVKIRGFRIELGEVEAVLLKHPGVAEAVVIVREDRPGDKRLAGYVAARGALGTAELRTWLKEHLPDYMVPSALVMLGALPLTPNGKVDRRALPAPEEAASAAGSTPPRNVRELQLLPLWESVLGVSPIGVEDNFFELGGHSLLAVKLLNTVREATGRQLPIASLFQGPTIARQAELLEQQESDVPWSPLVPIRSAGDRTPFFCVHGGFGSVFCFTDLARELGPDQPFYALQPRGLYDDQPPLRTVAEMAARYIEAIREVQPHGPYFLGGYCLGGLITQEIARQLAEAGEEVPVAVMLDTKLPTPGTLDIRADEESFLQAITMPPDEAAAAAYQEAWAAMTSEERWAGAFHQFDQAGTILPPGITDVAGFRRWLRMYRANTEAAAPYRPVFGARQVVQFLALQTWDPDPLLGWGEFRERMQIHHVPGDHNTMLEPPHVRELAEQLRPYLSCPSGSLRWKHGS